MADLSSTVVGILRRLAGGRRLRVGVFARGNASAAVDIVAQGHRVIVMSDRFRFLYRLFAKIGIPGGPCSCVETSFGQMPIRPFSLDAMVLLGGMPAGWEPTQTLTAMRALLARGGAFVLPHPVVDGHRGRFGRLIVPARWGVHRPVSRHGLCGWAMSSGFTRIGQEPVTGMGPAPWVVTTGIAGVPDYVLGSVGKNDPKDVHSG